MISLTRPTLQAYAVSAALGIAGALIALRIGSPLPWFLGPMVANAIFAIAGVPLRGPDFLRPVALPVLGVMLGSTFRPELFAHAAEWAVSLAMIPLYVLASSAVNYAYFRKVAGCDHVTAYFSSMPGGLNDMLTMGSENGGDEKQIALAHALRVLISVGVIAVILSMLFGVSNGSARRTFIGLSDFDLHDAATLIICAVLGPILGKRFGIPARMILGPLAMSAAVHLFSVVEIGPPTALSLGAQFVLGAGVGGRFAGIRLRSAARLMLHGSISALIATFVAALFGLVVIAATDIDFFAGFLAFAPGGMMEMSLLALAINQSVAYVTLSHIVRYMVVAIFAGAAFRMTARRDR